jgi:hypothetical protein
MPKRSSNPKDDPNALAHRIVREATGEPPTPPEGPKKNPAAVALGRLGGLKGGVARAKALSASKRRLIAKRAAEIRWHRKGG